MPEGRTAVLQIEHSGHRLFYVSLIAKQLKGGPTPTLLTTTEALHSPEFAVHLADLATSGHLRVELLGSAATPRLRLVVTALRFLRHDKHGALVVPELDRLMGQLLAGRLLVPTLRAIPLRGLLMRTPQPRLGTRHIPTLLKPPLARLLHHGWPASKVFFLTDAFGVVRTRPGYAHAHPLRDPAPELPAADRTTSRQRLGIPPDAFVLGLLGDLSGRKFPELTLAALRLLPKNVTVLMAGRVSEELARAVEASRRLPNGRGRHVVVSGYLSDESLGECLAACNALVLTYDTDAPSGMLTSGALAGIPVIAAGSGWLCRVVEELRLGLTTELSGEGVARAATELMIPKSAVRFEIPATPPNQLARLLCGA